MMEELLKIRDRSVFTFQDLEGLFPKSKVNSIQVRLHRLVTKGKLLRLAKGIYGLPNYNSWELGNKLRTPSYITGRTVLFQEGIIFQVYKSIYIASNRSENIEIDGHRYEIKKIADSYLFSPEGIEVKNGVTVANVERAVLDWWYLEGVQFLDNERGVDWEKAMRFNEIIYKKKNIELAIKHILKEKI